MKMERLKQYSETRLEHTDESAITWSLEDESELVINQVNFHRRTTPKHINLSNKKTLV